VVSILTTRSPEFLPQLSAELVGHPPARVSLPFGSSRVGLPKWNELIFPVATVLHVNALRLATR